MERIGAWHSPVLCTNAGESIGEIDRVEFDAESRAAPGGVLYVGRDSSGSGGPNGAPGYIRRLGAGGRLLFTSFPNPSTSTPGEFVTSGGPPALLFSTTPRPLGQAVDSGNRIFVTFEDGTLRRYDASGALLNHAFATGLRAGAPRAIGSLSGAAEAICTVNAANQLTRISLTGTPTVMGTGFESATDFEFHGSGTLSMSEFSNDRVLKLLRATPAASPALMTLLSLALGGAGAVLVPRRRAEYVSSR